MTTRLVLFVGSLLLAGMASAHQVWMERGPGESAKVYYGEPAVGEIEKAGGGLDKIDPLVFHSDKAKPLAESRRDDHIQIDGVSAGDLRLVDERFPVWKEDGGGRAIYYAREGRSETRHALNVELVPVAAQGDAFLLLRDGKPVAAQEVSLVAPGGWSKKFKTDAKGQVVLQTPLPGRYIAEAVLEDNVKGRHEGQEISKTYHVSTISFTDPG